MVKCIDCYVAPQGLVSAWIQDLPYEQSVAMAKKLRIEHQFITVLGKRHLFEKAGFADLIIFDALHKVLVFFTET